MRFARTVTFGLIALCLVGAFWGLAGSAEPAGRAAPLVLASAADVVDSGATAANQSAWVKSAQARCPPGQLVFLTNACGCNGACCACSAQAPYLDHCSCQCSPTPPTTCNRGFSAGRR